MARYETIDHYKRSDVRPQARDDGTHVVSAVVRNCIVNYNFGAFVGGKVRTRKWGSMQISLVERSKGNTSKEVVGLALPDK
jgi:hypothetical protein